MSEVGLKSKTQTIDNDFDQVDKDLEQELTRSGFPRQYFRNVPHAIINPHRNTVNTLVNRGVLSQRDLRILNYIHSRTINIQREGFIDFTKCFTEGQRYNPNDQGTGIARTGVYGSLKHLEKLGLIHSIIRGKIRITWVNLTFTGDINTEWDNLPEKFKKHSQFMSGAFSDNLFTEYKFDRRLSRASHFKFLEAITKENAAKLMEIDVMLREMKKKKKMNANAEAAYETMAYYDSHDSEYHDDPKVETTEVESNYNEEDDVDVIDTTESVEAEVKPEIIEPKSEPLDADVSDTDVGDIPEDSNVIGIVGELPSITSAQFAAGMKLPRSDTPYEAYIDGVRTTIVKSLTEEEIQEEYDAYYADWEDESDNERIQEKRERRKNSRMEYMHEASYLDFREGELHSNIETKTVAMRVVDEFIMKGISLHLLVDNGLMVVLKLADNEKTVLHFENPKDAYRLAGSHANVEGKTIGDLMDEYRSEFGDLL